MHRSTQLAPGARTRRPRPAFGMSQSRTERARCVLKLCEYAARNLEMDEDDVLDPDVERCASAYYSLSNKINYLLPRSSAQWTSEFEYVLNQAHSMRITRIDPDEKESLRTKHHTCMACGYRGEHRCKYAIDLCGVCDPKMWTSGTGSMRKAYNAFVDGYNRAFNKKFVNPRPGTLPEMDMGTYIVGDTCLRKAQLRFMLQTMLLDATVDAEHVVQNVSNEFNLELDELYSVTPDRCRAFVQLQDNLELAIADERRPLPELQIDNGLWANVDTARGVASKGSLDRERLLVRERAGAKLAEAFQHTHAESAQKEKRSREHEEEWLTSGSEDEDEADGNNDSQKKNGKRRARSRKPSRIAAYSEDESEGSENEDGANDNPGPSSQKAIRKDPVDAGPVRTRRQAAKARMQASTPAPVAAPAAARAAEEGSAADVHAAPAHALEEAAPVASTGRQATGPSASGLAGRQRAAGTLGSREAVLMGEMQLQLRLAQRGDSAGAAQCAATILTLQELIEQNKKLAHSPHL
tara:strand:- start:6367 stop:7935 length:1569 start_codon:yes stop_codon:yes gene_type:complete